MHVTRHAHCRDYLSISQAALELIRCFCSVTVGLVQRLVRHPLVNHCQNHHQDAGKNTGDAEPRVEQEHDADVDRVPRCIKKGEQTVTGQKLTKTGQILNGLSVGHHAAGEQGAFECGISNAGSEQRLQFVAGTHQDE